MGIQLFCLTLHSHTVHISNADRTFLGNDIKIDFNPRTYSLVLKNESGILDSNVFFNTNN